MDNKAEYLRQRKSDAEVAERIAQHVDPENAKLFRGYRLGIADALIGHMTITAPALEGGKNPLRMARSSETQNAYWNSLREIQEKQGVTLKKARAIYRKQK